MYQLLKLGKWQENEIPAFKNKTNFCIFLCSWGQCWAKSYFDVLDNSFYKVKFTLIHE